MPSVHFIAIGGAVMHNLALALKQKGYQVSGSDDEINEPSRSRLEKAGLLPDKQGWFPERITAGLDAVILGMHAKRDNPELLKANELNLPVYSFPEYLYQQTSDKLRVVIGGSHGKTTITSMVMHVLKSAGKEFDYMVGAGIEGFETMVRLSREASLAVFEGDEYLSSAIDPRPKFHLYRPKLALLSGISWDHINVFPTREIYVEQFEKFIRQMDEGSVLVWCAADPELAALVQKHGSHLRLRRYDTPKHRIEGNITILETPSGDVPLRIFGRHNLQNLEGARMICDELNISETDFYKAIREFKGAARRLELIGSNETVAVYRDFAHAPSKLKATVKAAKEQFPSRKLVACMELHTFSSLNHEFLSEYEGSMEAADIPVVFINPKNAANKNLGAIPHSEIQKVFGANTHVFSNPETLSEYLHGMDWNSRNLLLMSSGTFSGLDVHSLAKELTA